MGLWSFVKPEATTNLISNPSVETATTGYTAVGGVIARSTAQQTKGLYSLAVTPGVGVNDGVYYTITLVATTEYTFSVDVLGVTGIPYRIYIYDTIAPVILGTPTTFTGDGTWRRYIVTATTGANTACRVYVEKNNHASVGAFYIDALQVEVKGYATTYCDGDQDGCSWAAGEHTSTSSRSAQSSAGGRVIDLDSAGYEFEVKSSIGVGHAPIEIIDTLPAQSDGGDFQDQVARPRDFQLVGAIPGTDRSDYHLNRLNLIEAVNPHRLATKQPVQLRYSVSEKSVAIGGYYARGLEKNQQAGPTIEEIALRFRAEDPLFKAITGHVNGDSCGGQGALDATVQQNLANLDYCGHRGLDGVWDNMDSGTNATVHVFFVASDGTVYVGGAFTQVGSGALAANRIARYDPETETWSALGVGLDANCYAIAEGPDGDIYVGGSFHNAGGGAALHIAHWNGAAWAAMGPGFDDVVYDLKFSSAGVLYAGGVFQNSGAVPINKVGYWSGAAWAAMGTGPGDVGVGVVYALAFGPDSVLYAGGGFTTLGTDADYIAQWDGANWVEVGGAFDNIIWDLDFGPDGTLYAGGDFTTAMNATVSCLRIAAWNGTKWYALGSGMNARVEKISMASDGTLYAVGSFTTAGGLTLPDRMARWFGDIWAPWDIDIPGAVTIEAVLWHDGLGLFFGYPASTTAVVAGMSTVTNNGSVNTYPVLKATGPGQLYQLVNYTTGEEIYFDLELQDGETVTLDLRPGKKTFVSTFQGNIIDTIREGSDTELFHLMPGANSIALFIGDVTASAFLLWDVLHWSIDGVAA